MKKNYVTRKIIFTLGLIFFEILNFIIIAMTAKAISDGGVFVSFDSVIMSISIKYAIILLITTIFDSLIILFFTILNIAVLINYANRYEMSLDDTMNTVRW